jgi:hypothetical protein
VFSDCLCFLIESILSFLLHFDVIFVDDLVVLLVVLECILVGVCSPLSTVFDFVVDLIVLVRLVLFGGVVCLLGGKLNSFP